MAARKSARGGGMEDEARRRPLDRLLRRRDTPASELARLKKPVNRAARPRGSAAAEGMEEEAKRRSLDQRLRRKEPRESKAAPRRRRKG